MNLKWSKNLPVTQGISGFEFRHAPFMDLYLSWQRVSFMRRKLVVVSSQIIVIGVILL